MTKSKKVWLLIATVLTVIGLLCFTFAILKLNFNFKKLSTVKYKTATYEISENFNDISVNTSTVKLTFKKSDGNTCKVEVYEAEKSNHKVSTDGQTLNIDFLNQKNWYDNLSVTFETEKITVYLPKNNYDKLSVTTDTGDVFLSEDFKFNDIKIIGTTSDIKCYACAENEIEISTVTGTQDFSNLKCNSIDVKSSTGDLNFDNVVVTENFNANTHTGNVKLNHCDAKSIKIKTSTGNVNGTLLSGKIFTATSETGNINLPKNFGDNECKITTDTGNIKIEVKNEKQ